MNNSTALSESDIEFCWNVIGVAGDSTCSELSTVSHCRNCSVYSTTGRFLLQRSIPEAYRLEWTQLLAQSRAVGNRLDILPAQNRFQSDTLSTTKTLAVVIFRLQREWLALNAQIIKETTLPSVIHTIPYRSNQILKGLVNIRGELQLCISLNNLLNLEAADTAVQRLSPIAYSRMLVMEKASHIWVFAVDELYGLYRFHQDELRDATKSTQANHRYTKGTFQWYECSVSYLDDELLFHSLSKKVTP